MERKGCLTPGIINKCVKEGSGRLPRRLSALGSGSDVSALENMLPYKPRVA